jgi:hypothetical protein
MGLLAVDWMMRRACGILGHGIMTLKWGGLLGGIRLGMWMGWGCMLGIFLLAGWIRMGK